MADAQQKLPLSGAPPSGPNPAKDRDADGARQKRRRAPSGAPEEVREQGTTGSAERTSRRSNRSSENAIRWVPTNLREGAPTQSSTGLPERSASGPKPAPVKPAEPIPAASPASNAADADPRTVPQAVRDRFVQDGRRFYFPDGAPAFKDFGKRLTTPSENTEVVHSLIEIAQARGWNEIAVSGTERFRREAWQQARLAGLTVRGYKPNAVEQAQLVRAFARRSDAPEVGLRRESDPAAVPSEALRPVSPPGSREAVPRSDTNTKGGPPRERIAGKLLDHGHDTYRHDPHEEPSYFVRIQTGEGKREIWGRDLERAMTKSLTQPQIGDEITLQRTGQEPVTVKRHERDPSGRVVKEKDFSTYRNRWVIERSEFFEARAAAAGTLRDPSIAPQRAVRQHPELAGTYLNLKAAEIAARAIRDPEDQRRFVSLVRGALADQVERGEALQPVRLRDRGRTPQNRGGRDSPELTPART